MGISTRAWSSIGLALAMRDELHAILTNTVDWLLTQKVYHKAEES